MANRMQDVLRGYPLMRMLGIILLAGSFGLLRNTLFSDAIRFGDDQTGTSVNTDALSESITLQEGRQLRKQGVQFLDARLPENYNSGHISGAINIPASATFQEKVEMTQSLNPDAPYVIYCNDPACPLGDELYEFLQIAGFKNLHIMDAGYDGWEQAGYPVERGGDSDAG